jgi:hypothetical protein
MAGGGDRDWTVILQAPSVLAAVAPKRQGKRMNANVVDD